MVEVKKLTKNYGNIKAVDNISFTVGEGEILGFLGPNGAGKSTTMNIITGYISSTSGTVTIDGKEILENPKEAKAKIGYLPEIPPLYTDMTVKKYLEFMFDLKKVKLPKKEHIEEVMRLVRITEQADLLKTSQKVIVSVSVLPRLCSAIRPCLFWTSRLSDLTLCRLSKSENLLKVLAKSIPLYYLLMCCRKFQQPATEFLLFQTVK